MKMRFSPLAPWKFETTKNVCAAHPLYSAAFQSGDIRSFSILYGPGFKSQLFLAAGFCYGVVQLDGQMGLLSMMERLASNGMAFTEFWHSTWKFGFLCFESLV